MIYLDNAATSFPKPAAVIEEAARCMRQYGGNPGRGSHRLAMEAAEKIFACRTEIAELFGVQNPESVIFTVNATMALNLAIKGLLRKGDHVLISDLEHNAVLRPVYRLAEEGIVTYDVFPSQALDPRAKYQNADLLPRFQYLLLSRPLGGDRLLLPPPRDPVCGGCGTIGWAFAHRL